MINDLKLGFKLMKYGLQFKTSIVSIILFMVLGIVLEMTASDMLVGSFYILMGGVYIYQLIQSVTCAGLAQTSPQKKRLQTSAPAVCGCITMLIANTITIVVKLFVAHFNHTPSSDLAVNIIALSVCIVVLMVYLGSAMKAFWLSTLVFLALLFGMGFLYGLMAARGIKLSFELSVGAAIAVSYFAVFIGSGLVYLISLALYKKDFSKMTFQSALRRAK